MSTHRIPISAAQAAKLLALANAVTIAQMVQREALTVVCLGLFTAAEVGTLQNINVTDALECTLPDKENHE